MQAEFRFEPRLTRLDDAVDVPRALTALAGRAGLCALDSAGGEPRRFSLVLFDPVATLGRDSTSLEDVRRFHARLERDGGDELPGPFQGGFAGAVAYDLGAAGERSASVAPEPWGFPLAVGGLYTDFLLRDEARGESWLVLGESPGDERAPVAARRAAVLDALAGAGPLEAASAGTLQRHVAPHEHMRRIECVRADIARGDVYQVNLAHRFSAPVEGHPLALYLRLRQVNPAPYMGYCAFDDGALLSASPELLLEYDGLEARTRPIKGTRPRDPDPLRDAELAAELLASAKDRAELAMIIDLERNDLGKVAVPGGVRVDGWPSLASYSRVHHLMADVLARPRQGVGAFELLAALFPGGSVTGAPKLAAMARIAALEGEGRGFFCGALGCVDTRGRCTFNLLIRTLLWRPRPAAGALAGEVSFRVGGGITWSSEAAAEERETLDKAAGLVAALSPTYAAR
jgi:para-aminobenzoate synthetase component I